MGTSDPVKTFVDEVAQKTFDMTKEEAQAQQVCIDCKGEAKSFRDDISLKEYKLSAFCQVCQDKIFENKKTDSPWRKIDEYPPADGDKCIVWDIANGCWDKGVWVEESNRFIKEIYGSRESFHTDPEVYIPGPPDPYKINNK